jgi:capsular polysaccharide biosynthesis protein
LPKNQPGILTLVPNQKKMELREYYKILRSNIAIVIYTVIIAIVVVYAWSVRKAETYSASFLLDIGRTSVQNSADYKYDQFYQLQADEKFGDTIVEWLKSPGVAKDIFEKSDINSDQATMRQLAKSFRAERMASNVVSVQYSTSSSDEASKIAPALESAISDKVKNLNATAKDPNWFQVDMSDLIIMKNTQNLWINFGIAAIAGIFLGTLLAFGKHYISE